MPEKAAGTLQILEDLGKVPFGRAVRGVDTDGETPVVVQWVDPARVPSMERDGLIAEARALTRLVQPGLPVVYEMREEADGLTLVFEPPPAGAPLEPRRLDRRSLVEAGSQVLVLLAEAHVHGVLHRHLGSGMVFRVGQGRLALVGFGLTRLRDDPTWEPPPEVAAGGAPSLASDLHAVGRLIEGWARCAGSDLLGDPAEDPLAAVLSRATERDPAQRYEDAAEMARALSRAAALPWSAQDRLDPEDTQELTAPVRASPVAEPSDGSPGRQRGGLLAAALAVALVGGIWIVGGLGGGDQSTSPGDVAPAPETSATEAPTPEPLPAEGAPARLERARSLVEQDRTVEAEPILEDILLSGDLANPVPVLDLLGTLRLQSGKVDDAAELFERAVALQPSSDLHYKLGLALAAGERGGEALEQLRAARDLDPASSEIQEAIRHLSSPEGDSGGIP